MTTDELLMRLRKATSAFEDSSAEDDNLLELAGEMVAAFQELDAELSKGEDLPRDWGVYWTDR